MSEEQLSAFLETASFRVKKILQEYSSGDLLRVQHFLDPVLYQRLQKELNFNLKNDQRKVYEEIHVDSTLNREYTENDSFFVEVLCTCKCISYIARKEEVLFGLKDRRTTFAFPVLFEKKKDAKDVMVDRCLGCGNPLPIDRNGVCPQCGRVYDLALFDYVIKEMGL
ncbi:MAG: hypothetical protein J6X28_04200 [Bacilli bacterium]|nr:hypothetical protein [Bacilli bacterium]